jgi:hypothetical protein
MLKQQMILNAYTYNLLNATKFKALASLRCNYSDSLSSIFVREFNVITLRILVPS